MNNAATIAFSVIVPTRDRPHSLARCLESLAWLEYRRENFEVVVVDDGSERSPQPVVSRFRDALRVRLIRRRHAGPAATRNAGAAEAAHPFLAFTDDDCRVDPGWLAALARTLRDDPKRLVGGAIVNSLPRNPFSSASQRLVAHLYEYFNSDTPRFFCSNNLAVPRAAFLAIGGFDASFPFAAGEDRDFCDRWSLAGHPMRYDPEAIVHHAHDLNLSAFWRQHLRYGRAAAHYHQLFAARRGGEVAIEPARFYLDLVRHPFRDMPPVRAGACAALLLISQIANASGFFYERYRSRRSGLLGRRTGEAR